uniref:Uncharacterized protein n=1 Tax=Sinocyclocheilus anshuiensis TaxID=1608454 RepID=A0A671RID4_9TELE
WHPLLGMTMAYLDSSAPTFAHGIWYSSTRRIDHGHKANEAQVLSGKVHLICIKLEVLRELLIRKVEVLKGLKESPEANSRTKHKQTNIVSM